MRPFTHSLGVKRNQDRDRSRHSSKTFVQYFYGDIVVAFQQTKTMEVGMGNLNLLSTEKMLALTQYWTVDERTLLTATPQTAGLLVSLDAAFTRLTHAAKRGPAPTGARDIYKKQRRVDLIHDQLLRGNFYYLTALACYAAAAGDEVAAAMYLALRDQMYPEGLAGTSLSYDEEAGAAEILEKNLSDEVRLKLKGIVITPGSNLLEKVLSQMEQAKMLRVLEQQKKAAQQTDNALDHANDDERKTRYEWIDTVRTLERNLRLAKRNKNLSQELETKLLQGLRDAQKEAAQKDAEEKKREEEAEKARTDTK
jgi:hypothetical protein